MGISWVFAELYNGTPYYICANYKTCQPQFYCFHKKISTFSPKNESKYWCHDIKIRKITDEELYNVGEIGHNL